MSLISSSILHTRIKPSSKAMLASPERCRAARRAQSFSAPDYSRHFLPCSKRPRKALPLLLAPHSQVADISGISGKGILAEEVWRSVLLPSWLGLISSSSSRERCCCCCCCCFNVTCSCRGSNSLASPELVAPERERQVLPDACREATPSANNRCQRGCARSPGLLKASGTAWFPSLMKCCVSPECQGNSVWAEARTAAVYEQRDLCLYTRSSGR